jgi:hypothetical protein
VLRAFKFVAFAVAETAQAPPTPLPPVPLPFYASVRARSFGIYDDALSEAVFLLQYEEVAGFGFRFARRRAEIVLTGRFAR